MAETNAENLIIVLSATLQKFVKKCYRYETFHKNLVLHFGVSLRIDYTKTEQSVATEGIPF